MPKRQRQRQKPRKRKNSSKNLFFVAFLFTGLVLLAFMLFPSFSRLAGSVRAFLFETAGLLAFLLPAVLLLGAVRALGTSFLRGGFAVLLGAGVNGYFLAAIVDMLGRRFDPAFAGRPGGILVGKAVTYLTAATSDVAAYLILLACLSISLVVFTGWDLAEGVVHLGRTAEAARARVARRPGEGDGNVPEFLGDQNAWARSQERSAPPEVVLPGFGPGSAAPMPPPPARNAAASAVEPAGTVTQAPPAAGPEPAAIQKPAARQARESAPAQHRVRIQPPSSSRAVLPPLDRLEAPSRTSSRGIPTAELDRMSKLLVQKLNDFGVECQVSGTRPGPVITRFELKPGQGVRVNKVIGLQDDLALALKAEKIRILAPIPGRDAIGVEVPNANPETVYLRDVISAVTGSEILPVALGKKLEGEPFVIDLSQMPHLLVAGTTGSGKSVCIHSMICTLLMRLTPDQVRLALIDPKRLELSAYEDIPHLCAPVVVDVRKAKLLLERLVGEMDRRYILLQRAGARSILEYNSAIAEASAISHEPAESGAGPDDGLQAEQPRTPLPHIVLVIDELADLMLTAANDVEPPILRLAQMARAVGIHLVLATQRPSVDVITGVIKANFPSRIAFSVLSKTDSRTILDMNGADELLGKGDMLLVRASAPEPLRVHGSFISPRETHSIADFWREQALEVPRLFALPDAESGNTREGEDVKGDELLDEARRIVIQADYASVTMLQKNLNVGYPRAARLLEMLEKQGVVGPFSGGSRRKVLVKPEPPGGLPGEDRS
jgi:S-DNA-T family DNA segregation ATPase FtsK/SpoIIIE